MIIINHHHCDQHKHHENHNNNKNNRNNNKNNGNKRNNRNNRNNKNSWNYNDSSSVNTPKFGITFNFSLIFLWSAVKYYIILDFPFHKIFKKIDVLVVEW